MAAVVLEVVLSPVSGAGFHDMPRAHDKIDGGDAGIEKHVAVGGTPLVPSSHFKISEHHHHNPYRCCS